MAAIGKTTNEDYGATTVTVTELTGTDTLTDKSGSLYVFNQSASSVDLLIDGDGGTTVNTDKVGAVDVSGGFTLTVAAGALVKQPLGQISGYLSGDVDVTGGTADVFAWVG